MSKRIIFLLLAVSLGLNVGVIATTIVHRANLPAPPPPPGPRGGGPGSAPPPDPHQVAERHVRGMTRHLDLDTGQQEAIRSILVRHSPRLVESQAAVDEVGRRLTEVFAAPEFEAERFRRLTAEAGLVRSRLDSLSAVMLLEEAAVLTPAQRRKFAEVAPTIHNRPQRARPGGGPPPR